MFIFFTSRSAKGSLLNSWSARLILRAGHLDYRSAAVCFNVKDMAIKQIQSTIQIRWKPSEPLLGGGVAAVLGVLKGADKVNTAEGLIPLFFNFYNSSSLL